MERVFMFGHSDAPESIKPELLAAIRISIQEGAGELMVGHFGEFDRISAEALSEIKQEYPDIVLTLVEPYPNSEVPLPARFNRKWTPKGTENHPPKARIIYSNEKAIDVSYKVICYVEHPFTNSIKFLAYAEKRQRSHGLRIQNISGTRV